MPQTKTVKLTRQHKSAEVWGEQGSDEFFIVPNAGIKIVATKVVGRTRDPSNNNAVVAAAFEKLGPAHNKMAVNWWRNGGFDLEYDLTIKYETTDSADAFVKSRTALAPLLKRSHGIAPVTFMDVAGVYYPEHFSVEVPRTAVVESVLVMIGNPLTTEAFDLVVSGDTIPVTANILTPTPNQPTFFSAWRLTATAGSPPTRFSVLVEWSIPAV